MADDQKLFCKVACEMNFDGCEQWCRLSTGHDESQTHLCLPCHHELLGWLDDDETGLAVSKRKLVEDDDETGLDAGKGAGPPRAIKQSFMCT